MEIRQQVAGLKPRTAAWIIDFLIIFSYAGVLFIVGWLLRSTTSISLRWDSAIARDLVVFATLIFPVILYFSLQESSARQATIGKRKQGLMVINANGRRLSTGRALLRSGLKFLPWQMAHTAIFQITSGNDSAIMFAISILAQALVILSLLFLVMDKRHRTLYDLLAGTSVVKQTADR